MGEIWAQLIKECIEAELPEPKIYPIAIPGGWRLEIGDSFKLCLKDPEQLLLSASTWTRGYIAGRKNAN